MWAERQSVTARQRTTLCVCVGVVWCEGPCVCVCGGGGGVVWGACVGGGAETEAERHSQAKDNAVCVLGGRGGGGGGGWCVADV